MVKSNEKLIDCLDLVLTNLIQSSFGRKDGDVPVKASTATTSHYFALNSETKLNTRVRFNDEQLNEQLNDWMKLKRAVAWGFFC